MKKIILDLKYAFSKLGVFLGFAFLILGLSFLFLSLPLLVLSFI